MSEQVKLAELKDSCYWYTLYVYTHLGVGSGVSLNLKSIALGAIACKCTYIRRIVVRCGALNGWIL